jgi:meso-butanediol dehydrogenase / (S,S)-butanediol dehydrogenase / diacetyl reductase
MTHSSPDTTLPRRFEGRVALITGAGSGLGRATARRLAAEGARVAVLDIVEEAAAGTVELIAADGGDAAAFVCDVTDEESVRATFDEVETELGRIGVVVPNAGISGAVAQIPDISLADWNRVVAVNLTGVFLCAKYGIPALRRNGGGTMVITASNASVAAEPLWGAYAATKGGAFSLTKSLGIDHGDEGIRVNCICPGPIDTPLLRAGYAHELGEEIVNDMTIDLPVKIGKPDQIAAIIAFLASDESELVNATGVLADSGSTSRMGAGFGGAIAEA